MKTALSIAGSDSSGGAGIQADLKTFSALGVFGMTAITAVTAQNTCGVRAVENLSPEIISGQIAAVFEDIPVNAVKIGMLSSREIVETVSRSLRQFAADNIVLDPVMISKSGHALLSPAAMDSLIKELVPLAKVVTPNLSEAAAMTGLEVNDLAGMEQAAKQIKAMGAEYVLIKGGHLAGAACDLLYDASEVMLFTNKRLERIHTHGTGCTLSSAIAAGLARGLSVTAAVSAAKCYITTGIEHGFKLGQGIGPTHHFYDIYHRLGWE